MSCSKPKAQNFQKKEVEENSKIDKKQGVHPPKAMMYFSPVSDSPYFLKI